MKSYLLFTLISFVSADVYERFLNVEDGPKTITCSNDSLIVTNTTEYVDCNNQQSCKIGNHTVTYVCLKKRFEKSNCENLKHDVTPKKPCVFNSAHQALEVRTKDMHEKCVHIFALGKSFGYSYGGDINMTTYSAFFYKKICEKLFRMNVVTNGWILFIASNSSMEDFSGFFSERYQKEADTSPKTRGSAAFYVFIILGIIIFILLLILLVVAYFFYRKTHPGRKHSKGILPSDFNYFPSGHQSSISVDNIIYRPGEKAGPETLARSSQLNHSSQNSAEMIYSTIDEEEVGGPVTAEDPSFVVVHGDVYAVVNKGDPSHEKPSNIADDLRREEVNGQLYTFVGK